MHTATLAIEKAGHVIQPEISPGAHGWEMWNDAGTEREVGEFLHALVGLVKPGVILETGTHKGISTTYMAHAMRGNVGGGEIHTYEIFQEHIRDAKRLGQSVGVDYLVTYHHERSLEAPWDKAIDLLFLDSEPQLRFDEFLRFWPFVAPGGIIMIHDLHPHLGHTGTVNTDHPNEPDWPWGDFRDKLGPYILDHSVQTINFKTPRGFTLFQKAAAGFAATSLLRGDLK